MPKEGTFSTLLQKGDKSAYLRMLILNIKIVSWQTHPDEPEALPGVPPQHLHGPGTNTPCNAKNW